MTLVCSRYSNAFYNSLTALRCGFVADKTISCGKEAEQKRACKIKRKISPCG